MRSSAAINGSASPPRPSEIMASTASGMNDAVMISVPGIDSNVRCIGCIAASASASFPIETSRNPSVITGHSARRGDTRSAAISRTARASARESCSRPT